MLTGHPEDLGSVPEPETPRPRAPISKYQGLDACKRCARLERRLNRAKQMLAARDTIIEDTHAEIRRIKESNSQTQGVIAAAQAYTSKIQRDAASSGRAPSAAQMRGLLAHVRALAEEAGKQHTLRIVAERRAHREGMRAARAERVVQEERGGLREARQALARQEGRTAEAKSRMERAVRRAHGLACVVASQETVIAGLQRLSRRDRAQPAGHRPRTAQDSEHRDRMPPASRRSTQPQLALTSVLSKITPLQYSQQGPLASWVHSVEPAAQGASMQQYSQQGPLASWVHSVEPAAQGASMQQYSQQGPLASWVHSVEPAAQGASMQQYSQQGPLASWVHSVEPAAQGALDGAAVHNQSNGKQAARPQWSAQLRLCVSTREARRRLCSEWRGNLGAQSRIAQAGRSYTAASSKEATSPQSQEAQAAMDDTKSDGSMVPFPRLDWQCQLEVSAATLGQSSHRAPKPQPLVHAGVLALHCVDPVSRDGAVGDDSRVAAGSELEQSAEQQKEDQKHADALEAQQADLDAEAQQQQEQEQEQEYLKSALFSSQARVDSLEAQMQKDAQEFAARLSALELELLELRHGKEEEKDEDDDEEDDESDEENRRDDDGEDNQQSGRNDGYGGGRVTSGTDGEGQGEGRGKDQDGDADGTDGEGQGEGRGKDQDGDADGTDAEGQGEGRGKDQDGDADGTDGEGQGEGRGKNPDGGSAKITHGSA